MSNPESPWPAAQGRQIPNLKWDERGLIPAIVQDAATGEVLTLWEINEFLRLNLTLLLL